LAAAGYLEQFSRLRDGDRFWYERDPAFTAAEIDDLRNTRLSDVIRRNAGVTTLQANVFFAVPEGGTLGLLIGATALPAWRRRKRRAATVPGDRQPEFTSAKRTRRSRQFLC
jgi:hypothetical protein